MNNKQKVFGNRNTVEGAVLFSSFHNLEVLSDFKLVEDDFKTDEGKLLFTIGKILNNKGFRKIDQTTLLSELEYYPELKEQLASYGGTKNIIQQMKYVDSNNAELYVDNLLKANYLDDLKAKGYDPTFNDKETEKIRQMNYDELQTYIEYQVIQSDLKKGVTMRGVEITDLFITDEARQHYFEGDIVETVSFHETCPILNNIVNGLPLKACTMIASSSGGSKSTFVMHSIIFPAIERGERVVLISNEMLYQQYEAMLITIVARKVFGEYNLTRDKLNKGVKDPKDRETFDKAVNYINEKLAKKLRVVFYSSGKMDVVLKTIKKESKLGCRLVIYDVMKVEDSRNQAWSELIEMSKKLDFAAKEHNIALVIVNQLNQTSLGKRRPTRADLSEGKDVIKVVSNFIIFRWLQEDEFTGEKNDANFYTLYRNEETGKWGRKKFELKKSDNIGNRFLVAYIDKNRYGKDGEFLVYKFESQYAVFREICLASPVPDSSFKR